MKKFRPYCAGFIVLYVLCFLCVGDAVYSIVSQALGTANEYMTSFSMFSYLIAILAFFYVKMYAVSKIVITDTTMRMVNPVYIKPEPGAKRAMFIYRSGETDIKLMDNQKHKDWIGVDNHRILDNYRFLVSTGADILVRTPLIPGYTDSDDNIRSIAEFIYVSDPKAKYELLNFNPLCQSKYDSLKQIYPVSGTALSSERISQLYQIIQETGLQKYKE